MVAEDDSYACSTEDVFANEIDRLAKGCLSVSRDARFFCGDMRREDMMLIWSLAV